MHPSLLPLSAIQCDVFHLSCSVRRRLIDYLRDFSILQGYDFEFKLFGILKDIWSDGVQCLWRLNKKVSQLLGVKIKAFVLSCPDIAILLRSKEGGLEQTAELVSLARALDLWYTIEYHLKRAELKVKDVNQFLKVLNRFESNINEFYQCGTETFLSWKGNNIGEEETYYLHLHTLKYYIPGHAQRIWETHKYGIGVFTMQ